MTRVLFVEPIILLDDYTYPCFLTTDAFICLHTYHTFGLFAIDRV